MDVVRTVELSTATALLQWVLCVCLVDGRANECLEVVFYECICLKLVVRSKYNC